eukprot:scaffold21599_cov31-Phaeocystis_antarctica.AAC.1
MKRGGPSSMNSAVCRRHRGCRRPEAGGGGRGRRLARPRQARGTGTSLADGLSKRHDFICNSLREGSNCSSSLTAGRRVQCIFGAAFAV